jgi:TrmH family RNA methyltransferase
MMKRVTSRQNSIVGRYRAAARRARAETILLDGAHLLSEALDSGVRIDHAAVTDDALARPEIQRLLDRLSKNQVETVVATPAVMAALSPVRSSSGIVALAGRPPDSGGRLYTPRALVLIAVDVQDPGNLGAIIRVAEAAGATGVVAAGASADPFGWKAVRGSMGSALRLPLSIVLRVEDALDTARRAGCRVVAAIPRHGVPLETAPLAGPTAVLIGGEGPGLPVDVIRSADARVTIGMESPVESLNAAITAALVLYEARRQRQALMRT